MVASTWNVELALAEGTVVGNETLMGDGSDPCFGWYAPAVNLHRTPFGGRNYEYYAEDPLLAGCMAAGVIHRLVYAAFSADCAEPIDHGTMIAYP